MRRLIPAILFAAALLQAQEYPLGIDSLPKDGVPKGVVTKYRLEPGKFYPGSPHDYWIYVPSQYDAAKPTPFMIFLDGNPNSLHAPVVFDNLIAKGELPPMIGIFISPGVLPAIGGVQIRAERIFEYDSINGRYAQFLIDEAIPEVAKKYNLSKDPSDHGIAGVSTGAVGAFMAAWERPDQFRRVLSLIGTFVAMKGADSLPALIRKSEPKPIRIFMQDGKNDHLVAGQPYGTFFAGSWPINNQVVFEDLQFAGYDVKLEIGEGGHDTKQGSAIMPDALRWLWRGYPQPIVSQAPAALGKPGWDPRAQVFSTVSPDKPWEQVGETYKSAMSPAPDKEGNVYFSDPVASVIYKSGSDGKVSVFKENSAGAKALRVGADGRLYASQPQRKRIVSFGVAGDEKTVAQNVTADDLVLTAKGSLYFVDSAQKAVGYIDASGKSRIVYNGAEMLLPSALSLSPDQGMLVVADGQNKFSWSFQIAEDGSLINGEPFFRVDMPDVSPYSGVAGVMVDSIGQVYFSSALGIQLCEQNGRAAAILSKPQRGTVTGIAFGGKDLNWIYATEDGKLFRRPSLRTGVASWAVVKPPNPPL
jgi:gluconolactonase